MRRSRRPRQQSRHGTEPWPAGRQAGRQAGTRTCNTLIADRSPRPSRWTLSRTTTITRRRSAMVLFSRPHTLALEVLRAKQSPPRAAWDEPDGPPLRRWSDLGCRRSLARPVLPVWSWLRRSTGAVSGHLRGLVARHHVGGFRPLTVPLWAAGPVLVPLRSSMTRSGQGAGFAGLAPAALPASLLVASLAALPGGSGARSGSASLLGKLSTDYEAMLHKTNRPLC